MSAVPSSVSTTLAATVLTLAGAEPTALLWSHPSPLPNPPPGPPPLSLSSAFAPIPGKVLDWIRSGAYVDFKALLSDNAELVKRLQELRVPTPFLSGHTQSKLCEVPDPLSWVRCFLLFMAARSDHPETRELAAYAVIIIDIARSHGGFGWQRYDAVFWQQKAAGATFPLLEINASLMSNTVFAMLNGSQGLTCELCFSSGHSKKDCALYCLEQHPMSSSSASTLPQRSRAHGRGNATQVQ